MNFSDEFKRRASKIKREMDSPIANLQKEERRVVALPVGTSLFNIFKRSLPVETNRIVLLNLTEDDANKAMKRLKTKQYRDADGTSHCIYYEKVSTKTVQPDDLYFNPRPFVISEIEILRGYDATNYDYKN